jgi:DNA repair protein RadC
MKSCRDQLDAQLDLFAWKRSPLRNRREPCEWRIVSVREILTPESMLHCETPEAAVKYWRANVATAPHFNADCECFAVLMLNVKRRIRGHHIVSIGSLNEAMAHPREVFRAAVIGATHAVVLMHNHPSGDPQPSDADSRITKRLVDSGRILGIDVLDHVIIGQGQHWSFREAGVL